LEPELLRASHFQYVSPQEHIMFKPRWSAFYRTGLDQHLRDRDVTRRDVPSDRRAATGSGPHRCHGDGRRDREPSARWGEIGDEPAVTIGLSA
jgi:hypothetical protein